VVKVLFIGNSHTYYNDMVMMFKNKCNENRIEVDVTMLTHGGKTLLWHSDEPEIRFNILYGEYDYVVLQDAAHPFVGEENLLSGVKKIKKYIDEIEARTVLYMTWEEKINIQNQEKMSLAYRNVASKTNSMLAPVGDYWNKAIVNDPNIELFADDGRHASELGSFLTSNVLYYSIFEELENIDIKTMIDSFKKIK